jgi:hypothetical protein
VRYREGACQTVCPFLLHPTNHNWNVVDNRDEAKGAIATGYATRPLDRETCDVATRPLGHRQKRRSPGICSSRGLTCQTSLLHCLITSSASVTRSQLTSSPHCSLFHVSLSSSWRELWRPGCERCSNDLTSGGDAIRTKFGGPNSLLPILPTSPKPVSR